MANKVWLIGRLTADPQSSTLDSGHSYCRFSLAVPRPAGKKDDAKTDFINIIAWDRTAEICVKYLSKGSQVAVTGSIQVGSYEKDGIRRQTFDIRAESVEFLSSPKDRQEQGSSEARPQQRPVSRQASIDDLVPTDDTDEMPF